MVIDQAAINQIASALARHFDSMYYVDANTGEFCEFMPSKMLDEENGLKQGDDFFVWARGMASKVVHPEDFELILSAYDRETILKNLSDKKQHCPCASYRHHVRG